MARRKRRSSPSLQQEQRRRSELELLSEERTELSEERTLLSYIRTALAVVGLGLVVLRFYSDDGYSGILIAVVLFCLAIFIVWEEVHRIKKLRVRRWTRFQQLADER